MKDENLAKLRALLEAYAERAAEAPPAKTRALETRRRACGEKLRQLVRPVLDLVMEELRHAGHQATTRDHTDLDNAYPSVALSFTPRTGRGAGAHFALASALIFRYDPRHGVVVHAEVKPSPAAPPVTGATSQRLGTIGVDALSAEWVETKVLNFVHAVLKAN
ncbi:MAG TPA: hypothetical protein VNI61_02600 [Gemmatimonadales bacterium]|nr:hypothetical protein [Gemmatimonadales bacterium]